MGYIAMTFTITQLLQLFVTACAAFGTIAGAVVIVIKIVQYFKKPDIERDEHLKRHKEMLDNDNKRLKALEEERKVQDETNRIIMKSLLAIMSHELDGNHTDQLRVAKGELEEYLINR
jgi:hypothetical protein